MNMSPFGSFAEGFTNSFNKSQALGLQRQQMMQQAKQQEIMNDMKMAEMHMKIAGSEEMPDQIRLRSTNVLQELMAKHGMLGGEITPITEWDNSFSTFAKKGGKLLSGIGKKWTAQEAIEGLQGLAEEAKSSKQQKEIERLLKMAEQRDKSTKSQVASSTLAELQRPDSEIGEMRPGLEQQLAETDPAMWEKFRNVNRKEADAESRMQNRLDKLDLAAERLALAREKASLKGGSSDKEEAKVDKEFSKLNKDYNTFVERVNRDYAKILNNPMATDEMKKAALSEQQRQIRGIVERFEPQFQKYGKTLKSGQDAPASSQSGGYVYQNGKLVRR